jgi:hypothetical protein
MLHHRDVPAYGRRMADAAGMDGGFFAPDDWAAQDWAALWQRWWRAVGLRAPLSGDVDQTLDAALIRSVGDQLGFINVNASRAGDAALERRITEEVASYGRQLGTILDALVVLIRFTDRTTLSETDGAALDALAALRSEIEMVKMSSAAERVDRLVADIEALRRDGEVGSGALDRLRQALGGPEAA